MRSTAFESGTSVPYLGLLLETLAQSGVVSGCFAPTLALDGSVEILKAAQARAGIRHHKRCIH